MPPLVLSRPLAALDLETTGLSIKEDRIVEAAIVLLQPDGRQQRACWRCNPGRPIPAAAAAVHGITDADVADCPPFSEVAGELAARLEGCDLAGFNIERFDLPMLAGEFKRAGIAYPPADVAVLDAYTIFTRRHPRDLAAALRFFCGRELQGAHGAEADAQAALDVLLAQVERYDDTPPTVAAWDGICRPHHGSRLDAAGKIVRHQGAAALSFGRHRLVPLTRLASEEPGYLRWLLTQDFAEDTLAIVRQALGELPLQPRAPAPPSARA